jgi:serine/threonine protein kinase
MTTDPQEIQNLFLKIVALPTEERPAALQRDCGARPEVRRRVEALLAAHVQPDSFLDKPPDPLGETVNSAAGESWNVEVGAEPAATADYQPNSEPGVVIAGRYTLVQKIGEGGMGEVWVAKQSEPVKRKVALKLIRTGMSSRDVLTRFEQERQALALMDHPNIARVLDAGMTGSVESRGSRDESQKALDPRPSALDSPGQPFFVMELVNGLPLNKYCDDARLMPRERLELFIPICQAVQHAHQKGIVHRDLKPANILITLYDGKPVPKVIDFGVAKATGGRLTDESMATQFGAIVGTLEYMSPEQAGFSAIDVDTRADIYSLGVILYELLTGLKPTDAARLKKAALTEMIRIIQEEEPSKPSTRLSTDASLPSLAASRHMDPKKLTALLRGELDCVVMKCLEKQRDRRYETANALARDIQRYLADEAVEARPPSAGYRLSKFLKRNKGPVIAAALVLFALLAGVAGTTVGMIRAGRAAEAERLAKLDAEAEQVKALQAAEAEKAAKQEAEREKTNAQQAAAAEKAAKLEANRKRKEAERNLAFAKKGNEILGSVFAGLNPKRNYATVAELRNALRDNLKKAVKELDGSAIGDPLTVAAMQNTLGLSLVGLGEAALAVEVAKKALHTRLAKLGPDHRDTLTSMNNVATAYLDDGQHAKALPLLEEALAKGKSVLGPDHPTTLIIMNNLAGAYHANGQHAKALPLLEETLAKDKSWRGPDHPSTLMRMHNLARVYSDSDQHAKALPLFEETLAKRKATLGPNHPNTITSMGSLATAYMHNGQHAKALPLYEQTLAKTKAMLGPDHPSTLTSMNNLASAYRDSGQFAKALPLFEELLPKTKARHGPNHPRTRAGMSNIKVARTFLRLQERYRDQAAKLGPGHIDTLLARRDLAQAYMAFNQLDQAETILTEVIAAMKDRATDDPILAFTIGLLGKCAAQREKTRPQAWQTFNAKSLLGGVLLDRKNYAAAEPLLLKGYAGMKQREKTIPAQAKVRLTEALQRLVQLYDATGKQDDAAKWRKERARYPEKQAPPPPEKK